MPIEEFTNQIMLDACLSSWQKKLFLNDWIIKASVVKPDEFLEENVCGENEFSIVNKSCYIRLMSKEDYGNRIEKYCAEKILVHELLHCKYNWLAPPNTMEGKYFDEMEHALIEQMAKSLIMTKYDIGYDYFMG